MQKVIVQIDWYTKIVLTVIAVLLAGLLAKPYMLPRFASATGTDYVTVDNESPIPVEVRGSVEVKARWAIPVKVHDEVLVVTREERRADRELMKHMMDAAKELEKLKR